jgi:hypothetical protein
MKKFKYKSKWGWTSKKVAMELIPKEPVWNSNANSIFISLEEGFMIIDLSDNTWEVNPYGGG